VKKPVFIITGGADGVGRELSAKYAHSHQIIIFDNNSKTTPIVAKKLHCDYQICDVTNIAEVESAIEHVNKKYGSIDGLINCAGLYIDGNIDKNDPLKIKQVFEVNTIGLALVCHFVVPYLKKHRHGIIINLNSQAGLQARASRSIYHASKWAVTGLTRSLQLELAPFGIKVVSIYPGQLDTKFRQKAGCKMDKNHPLELSNIVKTIDYIFSLDNSAIPLEIGIRHFPD